MITVDKSKPLRFVDPDNRDAQSRQIAERDLKAIHNDALAKRARKTLAGKIAQSMSGANSGATIKPNKCHHFKV